MSNSRDSDAVDKASSATNGCCTVRSLTHPKLAYRTVSNVEGMMDRLRRSSQREQPREPKKLTANNHNHHTSHTCMATVARLSNNSSNDGDVVL